MTGRPEQPHRILSQRLMLSNRAVSTRISPSSSLTMAMQEKKDVDHSFVQLMMMLLLRGNYPAIATHDEAIINATCKYARDHGISKEAFEFQMLYGIRRDLQEKLVKQGYNMRVYVP